MEDPKPHAVIQLWKSQIEEGNLNEQDPSVIIFDKDTESRYEILSADEGDKQMLHRFYDAFRGTAEFSLSVQVSNRVPVQPTEPPIPSSLPANSSLAPRYAGLARAINALVQSAKAEGVPNASTANTDGWRSLQRNSLNRYSRQDATAPSIISGHAQVDAARNSRFNGRGVPVNKL
ncbi:hypothetical protein SETIT_2G119600v2 [Setaria italica]|uniref:Uncharacterized protein n=1 Tax=Setaria italica TaxID=4555 RepID=A0A368PY17_SETIT|nr:hypothetical protein SETIT_2G119600v2 [Setaria italica]